MSKDDDYVSKLISYAEELVRLPATHSIELMADNDKRHFVEMVEERRGLDELKEWLNSRQTLSIIGDPILATM